MVIIDAQASKTTAGILDEVGYDANKKVKGRKRHIATDIKSAVMAAGMDSVFMHNKTGEQVLQDDVKDRHKGKTLVADNAYQGEPPFQPWRHDCLADY